MLLWFPVLNDSKPSPTSLLFAVYPGVFERTHAIGVGFFEIWFRTGYSCLNLFSSREARYWFN